MDVETELFDDVAKAVLAEYPKAFVSSEHVEAPPQFPALSVVESDNVEDRAGVDSSGDEVRAALTYTVNVYSNSQAQAKGECKGILAIVSGVMRRSNMARTMASVVDNARDPTIYRMTARYTGLVGRDGVMYRR